MGQALQEIRSFCRDASRLAPDARDEIRRRVTLFTESLFQAADLAPDHRARLLDAQSERISALADGFREGLVRQLGEMLGAELTSDELDCFARVPVRWERISGFVCEYTARTSQSRKDDADLALHYLLIMGTVHRMVEMEFLGMLGRCVAQMAPRLGQRLGVGEDDKRMAEVLKMGRCLRTFATDQVYTSEALHLLYSSASPQSEPSERHIKWVTGRFKPGKALECHLQWARYKSDARTHLDRISHVQAWDELLQLARAQGCLRLMQVIGAVRHHLRDTYKGEVGRPDREEPTDFPTGEQLAQEESPGAGGVQPGEAAAAAYWLRDRRADGHSDPELSVLARLGDQERLERHLGRLTPAERAAVLEVRQAVTDGQVTYAGKQEDSLRELWGRDYDRRRRAFSRACRKLRKLDASADA